MSHIRKIISISLMFVLLGCGAHEFSADKELFSELFSQQVLKKKVDIIIVVDNSTSMASDQDKLSREFGSFISSIAGSDYRIGVITTDAKSPNNENRPGFYGNLDNIGDNGELYISPESSNPSELFRQAIDRDETRECIAQNNHSTCVTPTETPIKALMLALEKRRTTNNGFFRRDAELGVVIITDEDETVDPDDQSFLSPIEFVTYFENEFEGSKLLQVFSISIPEGEEQCLLDQKAESNSGTAGEYGLAVSELARLTGGFNASICKNNFGSDLERISDFVESSLLITRIKLSGDPVLSSIKLSVIDVNNNELDIDWRVNNGYLELYPAPPEGSTISLSFRY